MPNLRSQWTWKHLGIGLAACVIGCVSDAPHVWAQPEIAAGIPQSDPTETQKVDANQLVEQLDSPAFSERRSAARGLRALGLGAIDALRQGVLRGSAEVTDRCFEILQGFYEAGTPNVSLAAKEALEDLAEAPDPMVAQRAERTLAPTPTTKPSPSVPQRGPNVAGMRIRMSVKNVNGNRTIEYEENGKKTIIKTDGKRYSVQRPGDPNPGPTDYPDLKSLKKQDPDAAKILAQNGPAQLGNGAMRLQIGPGPGFGGGFPPELQKRLRQMLPPQLQRDLGLEPEERDGKAAPPQLRLPEQPAPKPQDKPKQPRPKVFDI